MGGILHPRLNISKRSIVNKYREGKFSNPSEGELII